MKLIDLFSGAGGLSCGLEMSGFHPILANELNDVYASTYSRNHPTTPMVVGDIRQLFEKDLKKVLDIQEGDLDLLAGGPPCQGFSINAPIRTLDDDRNHLFKDFVRIAEILLPKAILIENVPGIISLGQGTVVEQIYLELQHLGYTVQHKILFAGHYGVPQMRFRTIFIALRDGGRIAFPEPIHDSQADANFTGGKELTVKILPLFDQNLKQQNTVWDAISDLPPIQPNAPDVEMRYQTGATSELQMALRDGCETVSNHQASALTPLNLERMKYIPQGGSWRDIPFDLLPDGLKRARRSDHTKRYGRLDPNGLCSTILTKCDPHWGSFFHPTQERVISVREAARIQTFPDAYIFNGSRTQQYAQVGNAVPPFMARALGNAIKTGLV